MKNNKDAAFPIATALRDSLKTYNFRTLKDDMIAGLVVSLIALPLSMALSIAINLPPQHGLYTAIVAGVIAALLGGSKTQVSGPTAAFVVILAPIVTQYGLHGIIWCQIMAGVMLIALGLARLGKLINYVPYPVTTGFTAGIAITIATLSLNDFLGLGIEKLTGPYVGKVMTIIEHLPALRWQETAIGLTTFVLLMFTPKKIAAKIPSPVIAITAGTVLSYFLSQNGYAIDTLNSRFSYVTPEGLTQHGIPPYAPTFHFPGSDSSLFKIPDFKEFRALMMPAFVIAALAALESLLSATVADSMARTRHDPNAEVTGLGIANIFTGLFAGIPATGAIARTATNIHAGARTPLAAVFHALLILLYMMTLARWIGYIPMAALAALLLATAYRMSHIHQFLSIIRLAPKSDTAVLLVCFLLTVFIDMVAGVSVGMILACLLLMKRMANIMHIDINRKAGPDAPHIELPPHMMVYHIEGPLFFGSVEKMLAEVDFINADIRVLVIDLSAVPLLDMTGIVGLKTLILGISRKDREIIIYARDKILEKIETNLADTSYASSVRYTRSLSEALEQHKTEGNT